MVTEKKTWKVFAFCKTLAWSSGSLGLLKMRMSNRLRMRISKLNMKELSLFALNEMDSLVRDRNY